MKQKADIIFDLEEQILPRLKQIKLLQGEVDTLQKTVSALRQLDVEGPQPIKETAQENNLSNYPGYPMNGTLIEKYRYLEDKTLRVWSKTDMEILIEQVEGKTEAIETLKSARQKTHYYISRHELIKLKYGNKNNYTFFTTRPEWVQRDNNEGKITYCLLSQHTPEESLLSGLTEEQRHPNNISWSGIN
ncbi:MAG TPA: hypothetical protein VN026_01500 [Bacteroidia bacterium]|jgi:hypothetical protein|nr:hypothetical protein [Bacteroidia bacterium]